MVDREYLNKHPGIEAVAKKIAYKAGKELFNLDVCILLLKSPIEVIEAYQYIYRSSRTLYTLCDFILYLKRREAKA